MVWVKPDSPQIKRNMISSKTKVGIWVASHVAKRP